MHVTTTCQWRLLCCKHCSLLHPACKTEVRILQLSKYQCDLIGAQAGAWGWAPCAGAI